MFREWKWGPVLCTSAKICQRLVSGVGEGYFEAKLTAETRLWCGESVIFISFKLKIRNRSLSFVKWPRLLGKKNTVFGLSKMLILSLGLTPLWMLTHTYVFFQKSAFHCSDRKMQKRNLKRTIESKPVNDCLRNLAYIIKIQQSLNQNIFYLIQRVLGIV